MAKKFSGFSTSIVPDKTSTSQFIVGYSGQDNAQWTMKALADEIGGGDNIYTADGDILAARTINDRAGGFTGTAGSNALKMNVRNSGALFIAGYQNNGDPGTTNNCVRWGPGTTSGAMNVRGNLALSGGGGAINLTGSSGQFFTVTQTGTTINTDVGIGLTTGVTSRLHVKGAGLSNATHAFRVQDSDETDLLSVRDDGAIAIGKGATSSNRLNTVIGDSASGGYVGNTNIGYNTSSGSNYQTAIGYGSQTSGNFAVAIGSYNTRSAGASSITLNATVGTGVTTNSGTQTFAVHMSSKSTPDFKVIANKGMIPPSITTTVRDAISSPESGSTIYNTTDNKLQFYNGTAWTDAGGGGGDTIFTTSPTSVAPTTQVIKVTDSIEFRRSTGSYNGFYFSPGGNFPNEYGIMKVGNRTFLSSYSSNEGWAFGGTNTTNSFHFNTGTTTMSDGWSMRVHGGTNANGALIVKGSGLTSSTTALALQDSGGADIFNVTDDGEVKIESNLSNYTGFRIKASNGSTGVNQTAYISDNFSGANLQDIKPFITKKNGSGADVRNTLFLGPASSTSVGYNNAGHTVVNGPWQGGTPSFNTSAGYFAPMINSSMFIAGGGNETSLFIGSGGQDSSHYALQVRSDNAHLNGSVWFQLRGDDRIVYKDGNEAANKVLTCDADGVATWQTGGGDNIYTIDGDIPTNTNREVTLTGTATLFFRNVKNQGDFRIGGDDNAALAQSNYSIAQSGSTINHYSYQSSFNVGSNSDPSNANFGPGTNWLYVSAQGLENHKHSVGVGISGTVNDRLVVKGRTLTSSKHSVRVTDANDTSMFSIRDDGAIAIGKGAVIQSTVLPELSTVLGYGAKDKASAGDGTISVAIGRLAEGNYYSVAVGANAKCLGNTSVALGTSAQANTDATVVGYAAGGGSTGASSVSLGKSAYAQNNFSIAIGRSAKTTANNAICLNSNGSAATVSTDKTFGLYMSDATTPDFQVKGTTTGNQASFVGQVKSGFKNSTSTFAFDWDEGNVQKSTATGAQTFSASNAIAGSTYILIIGTPTVTWGSSVKWPGGSPPILAGTTNIITLLYEGQGVYYATSVLNYS